MCNDLEIVSLSEGMWINTKPKSSLKSLYLRANLGKCTGHPEIIKLVNWDLRPLPALLLSFFYLVNVLDAALLSAEVLLLCGFCFVLIFCGGGWHFY